MRNTIHIKSENGKFVGVGKISKQRLFEAFQRNEFDNTDEIVEHFSYLGFWIQTEVEK